MRCAVFVALVACGGPSANNGDVDASADNDGNTNPDGHVQDPNDPVEDVPAHTGAYSFGKLTTDDFTAGSPGTYFNDDATEHLVTSTRVTYARYRDGMVLQSKTSANVLVYDQATTTVGAPIQLPSDAIGQAVVRGGLIYIGGNAKLYSYEIATQMWRMQPMPNTGACHHVAAGATRLFAICAGLADPDNDDLFSTWANKSMSDVVPIGTASPGSGAELGWLTVAPGSDTAYFRSETPDRGCVGRMTLDAHVDCAFSMRTLSAADSLPTSGQASDDGLMLYVTTITQSTDGHLHEVELATPTSRGIRTVDSYATCPDNSVVFQDGTISQRRAGGVNTDVRLGFGGQADMGCPLKKL